jgi:anti-sigma regulatory factor (Ser/Thr protein kinase)
VSEHGHAALQLQLDPDPSTPRAVRREFTRLFDGHPCLETLLLCLSEVVTNAVLHARTRVSVRASETGTTVRVEVEDGSVVKPLRRNVVEVSPTGRGLHLLDRLTTNWGIDMTDHGKTVWFEITPEGST